jgi:hypothetical protein
VHVLYQVVGWRTAIVFVTRGALIVFIDTLSDVSPDECQNGAAHMQKPNPNTYPGDIADQALPREWENALFGER